MHKSSDVPLAHATAVGPVRSQLIAGQYRILRNSDSNPDPNSVLDIPCSDSFSVIVQLEDFASHRLWRGGQLAYKGGHVSSHYANLGNWQEPAKGLSARQMSRAKELIANHLAEGLSVSELAQECSLSRSYFTRAFKRSTGMTPHEWLLKMRVEKAKQLMLHTKLNLSQIGLDCGFADQSHFSRIFLRITGTSPSRWRRFHQSGNPD
ncbi:AraC family transcriptional regulator [Pseudomonas sp. CR3202]|uniref:AraC family transcriptional regulator n=1 Tax=Pseudomonas sp. CR3202 TaxID=3351532 RepID=UPI003BF1EE7E